MSGDGDKIVMLTEQKLEAGGFTEDALAIEFARQHGEHLRYLAAWNRWLMWDGCRWNVDKTIHVFDLARRICREAAAKANKPQKTLGKSTTVAGVEKLAKADRTHGATVEQWDSNPWTFNTRRTHDR